MANAIATGDLLNEQLKKSAEDYKQKIQKTRADLTKSMKELAKWEDPMMSSLEGTCIFTPNQVKRRMESVQETIEMLSQKLDALQIEGEQIGPLTEEISNQHENLLTWAKMFDDAAPEEKKMLASHIIKAVTLSRDYKMKVEFNISEAQYLSGMEMG